MGAKRPQKSPKLLSKTLFGSQRTPKRGNATVLGRLPGGATADPPQDDIDLTSEPYTHSIVSADCPGGLRPPGPLLWKTPPCRANAWNVVTSVCGRGMASGLRERRAQVASGCLRKRSGGTCRALAGAFGTLKESLRRPWGALGDPWGDLWGVIGMSCGVLERVGGT